MAEGLLRHDAGDRFAVFSAGTKPGRVRPEAIAAMREVGIDISGHRSKSVDEFAGQPFDYVLTVCDNAKEVCPIFPAATKTIHHSFDDPAAFDGSESEQLAVFRRVRDEIQEYLKSFPPPLIHLVPIAVHPLPHGRGSVRATGSTEPRAPASGPAF
jgi:arsenate reductase